MTFNDVVWKNFKGSVKKYFAYFLSSSFSIMLFFMYATLYLNKELQGRDEHVVLSYIFPITIVAIALFSIFFINYAHSAFIKGRNKEFGVYMSLGINSKELRKLINMESLVISTASLLAGIGVGTLFSRLFQMIILSMLEIKNISYSLDYRSFLVTTAVFFVIFLTVRVRTFLRMRKIDISDLLREARRSEAREYSKKDPVLGGLGLIIMSLSVVFLFVIAKSEELNSNPMILMGYMVTAFLGVYLVISNGGNLILHLIKKSRFYQKYMLSITELHHKFNQNKKIIFVLSVLSTMTIFLVASPFSLLSLSETIAEMDKNQLEYVETDTVNKLEEGALDNILAGHGMKSNTIIPFLYLSSKAGSNQIKDCKPVISVKEYNNLIGSNYKLNAGEALNIVVDWRPGNHGINPGSEYKLYDGATTYQYKFIDSRKGEWVASADSFPSDSIVLINNDDYSKLSSAITAKNIGYYHMINFKNWKTTKGVVDSLRKELGDSELAVVSMIESYEELRSAYSVFLFVSTVLGILFFVAGGSVLYFKQFTELSEAKITFYKLFKIGITDKEMRNIVGTELLVIFFLPLIFGTFLGISLIYLTTFIVGGGDIIKEFLTNASIVVTIYFISQGIFYFVTRSKYIGEIVKG